MQFEFSTATRIIFGRGKLNEIGQIAKEMGRKVLVVSGNSHQRHAQLSSILDDIGIQSLFYAVSGEPTVDGVRAGNAISRQEGCDLVIGIGGGSVIDTAKAIAVLSTNDGDVLDYLEVIGRGKKLTQPGLPMIAIPTTAGTGSEVTRNSVIGDPGHKIKVSLRSPFLLPAIALIDPDLTISVPPEITANTGMDTLTQLIEPFVGNKANPLTDIICEEGLKYASQSLITVYQDGKDVQSRVNMALASLFSGFALANAQLGAVHGFAGVLGGMYSAPHGGLCACLLPSVLKVNILALQKRKPTSLTLPRYERIAQILTGNSDSTALDTVEFVEMLNREFHILPLSQYGVRMDEFPEIVVKSAGSSSMKGNPVDLTPDELYSILEMAL